MENLQELIEQEFEYKLPEGLMSVDDYMKPYRILENVALTKLIANMYKESSIEEIEKCKEMYVGLTKKGLDSFVKYIKDSIKTYE